MMAAAWLVVLALGADGFGVASESEGLRLESRAVPGSAFAELRLTTVTVGDLEALCARAFGTGQVDPGEPHLVARVVLESSPDERLTYEQIAPPLVSHRDFALRSRRSRPVPGVCRIDFAVDNQRAPPLEAGWVRIERLAGSFVFEELESGRVRVTHRIHMDPGGAVPAWLVEGTRREMSAARVKQLVSPLRPELPVAASSPPGRPAPPSAR